MISLTLDTKKCMAELLLRDTFNDFLFIEGSITTFNSFTIDGYLHREFFGNTETLPASAAYSSWSRLKEFCFSIIKGKQKPLDFKFILALSQNMTESLLANLRLEIQPQLIQGLYLNFRYDGSSLACVTGTSLSAFTMDKSLERAFDQWTREFFSLHAINWNE